MATHHSFRWGKWLVILLLIAGAGGGGWWYFKARRATTVEYQTAPVARGDITQAVTATGQVGPVLNVQVGSQISGIVKKLMVDYNSVVKSNQLIAEIDPSTYEIGVLKAEAQLANSKANLALAEVQARRADDLFAKNLIAASDHDVAKAQLLQAQAQVQSDEASLKAAQVQLSYCTIYAPVDGVVITRNVDVGQTVAASFNTPTLFQIANDLTKMQIDALISEADIGGVAVGQNVNFSVDAYPYRTFHGQVSQVRYGPLTNQNVITYDCVVAVNNGDLKLLPGMTANVFVTTAQRTDVLKIPNAALRFRPPDVPAPTNAAMAARSPAPRSPSEGGERPGGAGPGGRGGGGGPGSGPGGGGGSPVSRSRPERQLQRTVYVLPPKQAADATEVRKPLPVQIKVGISDGTTTEVLDGLEEGAQIVTGMSMLGGASANGPGGASANPFGGGGFRPRF